MDIDIFGFKKRQKEILELKNQNKELAGQVQEMASILTYKYETNDDYRGNEYNTYDAAIGEIENKYKGTADWGIWAGNIIDIRASFIVGKGLKAVVIGDGADREYAWVDDYLQRNNLVLKMPLIYAVEGEIDGKMLFCIYEGEKTGGEEGETEPKIMYRSYRDFNYYITSDPRDYTKYILAEYNANGNNVTWDEADFAYRKFGGRVSDPNSATPKLWRSLDQIDDVSKAMRDLRSVNNVMGNPIPYFQCASGEESKRVGEWLAANKNWRLQKALHGTADFKFVEITAANSEILTKEIINKLKIISSNTGVPIHFLGFTDQMSNRATADSLMDSMWASAKKDREIWESLYTELIRKVMAKQNLMEGKTPLDPYKIKIEVNEVTTKEFEYLERVYLPLFRENAISLETLLSKIPEMDVKAEVEKLQAEQEERDAKAEEIFNKGFFTKDNDDEEEGNENAKQKNNFNQENK